MRKIIKLIPSLFLSGHLIAAPYFCSSNGVTYAEQTFCSSACGATCTPYAQKTTGSVGACDISKYENFAYHDSKTYALTKNSDFAENISNLAQPKNATINEVLKSILSGGSAWIGLSDPLKSTSFNAIDATRFKFVDGSKPSFLNWESGQPDNRLDNADIGVTAVNGEHWAYMGSSGKWSDDGYHSSYGGDFKPKKKSLVEWSGALDCVNATPPQGVGSGESGYWCSDGADGLQQCTTINTTVTPTCSSGTWNSTTKMCESTTPVVNGGLPSNGEVLLSLETEVDSYRNTTTFSGIMLIFTQNEIIARRVVFVLSGFRSCHLLEPANYTSNILLYNVFSTDKGFVFPKNTTTPATVYSSSFSWNADTQQLTVASNQVIDFKNKTSTSSLFRFENGQLTATPTTPSTTWWGASIKFYEHGSAYYDGSITASFPISQPASIASYDPPGLDIGWGRYSSFTSCDNQTYNNATQGRVYTKASLPIGSCPPGSTLSGSSCITSTPGTCPANTTLTNGQCVGSSQSCPLGDYPCTDITGGAEIDETTQGENDIIEDGAKDENGNCADQIYIFSGKDNRCRKAGIQTLGHDCCKKGDDPAKIPGLSLMFPWGFEIPVCNASERTLAGLRKWGELDGQCHYVGSYCHEKWPVGGCVQTKKTYCCFSSPLARIINEGGRPQLGITWGTPKAPNCRGFKPEEFQKIDFSKVDFSEWIKLEVIPNVQNNAVGNIKNITDGISNNF